MKISEIPTKDTADHWTQYYRDQERYDRPREEHRLVRVQDPLMAFTIAATLLTTYVFSTRQCY